MAVVTTIIITHDANYTLQGIKDLLCPGSTDSGTRMFAARLEKVVVGLGSGAYNGSLEVIHEDTTSPAKATATVAITHANLTAGDTLTIGSKVITARAAGAVADEFNIGADATADAVALAAAINAGTLSPLITATAATGTVTLTYNQQGAHGNLVALATSDATAYGLSSSRFGTGGAAVSGGTFVSGVRGVYNYGTNIT